MNHQAAPGGDGETLVMRSTVAKRHEPRCPPRRGRTSDSEIVVIGDRMPQDSTDFSSLPCPGLNSGPRWVAFPRQQLRPSSHARSLRVGRAPRWADARGARNGAGYQSGEHVASAEGFGARISDTRPPSIELRLPQDVAKASKRNSRL
jgi:hypothetical protein